MNKTVIKASTAIDKRDCETYSAEITALNCRLDECQAQYREALLRLRAKRATIQVGHDFEGQLKSVLEDGFYTLGAITTDGLSVPQILLVTKPIILTKINKAQNISLSVPMGTFMVQIDVMPDRLNIFVKPWKDNLTKNSITFHPHIVDPKRPCFGAAQAKADKAKAAFDIKTWLMLLKDMLTQYNETSSYRFLHSFDEEYKGRLEKAESITETRADWEEEEPEEPPEEGPYEEEENNEDEPYNDDEPEPEEAEEADGNDRDGGF